ncbi:MAG: thioredoxin [Planctomycetota bacterium]|nr:thioredoxin [Planctomycetota bacterium]
MGKVVSVNDDNFKSEVKDFDGVVLVDFYADWCSPCRFIAPVVEKLAEENEDGKVKYVKLDVDESRQVSVEYGIRAVPTLILFKKGEEKDRMQGVQPEAEIRGRVESLK